MCEYESSFQMIDYMIDEVVEIWHDDIVACYEYENGHVLLENFDGLMYEVTPEAAAMIGFKPDSGKVAIG